MPNMLSRALATCVLFGLFFATSLMAATQAKASGLHSALLQSGFSGFEERFDNLVHEAKSRPSKSFQTASKRPPQARPTQKLKKPLSTMRPSSSIGSKLPSSGTISVSGRSAKRFSTDIKSALQRASKKPLTHARASDAKSQIAWLRSQFDAPAAKRLIQARNAVFSNGIGYKDGSRTTMQHILKQHGSKSTVQDKGKFASHMTPLKIRAVIRQALKRGNYTQRPAPDGSVRVEYVSARPIGKNKDGLQTRKIEVIIRDNVIQSAYPK